MFLRDFSGLYTYLNHTNKTTKDFFNVSVIGCTTEGVCMSELFADLKQAYVMGLLKALEHYDISQGVLFTAFKAQETFDDVHSMRTGYTVQSLAEYKRLWKAMAIWERFNRAYDENSLCTVALELDESVKPTRTFFLAAF